MTMSYVTVTCQDIIGLCYMIKSHNEHRKVVHKLCSSYISNI